MRRQIVFIALYVFFFAVGNLFVLHMFYERKRILFFSGKLILYKRLAC